MLAVWARARPRGFAHVEYHSEYARAEADRRLGEVLLREKVPYHHVELPVRVTPSQAGRYLLENLEKIESAAVSITGFATAVAEEERRDFLAILSVRREVLAEFGLCQIWWLTPDFLDAMMHIAPDLDSWFMVRLGSRRNASRRTGTGTRGTARPAGPEYRIDEALRSAASLVERFQRAKEVPTPTSELVEIGGLDGRRDRGGRERRPDERIRRSTRERADRACRGALADCLSTLRNLNQSRCPSRTQGRPRKPAADRAARAGSNRASTGPTRRRRDLDDLAGSPRHDRPDQAETLYRRRAADRRAGSGPRYLNSPAASSSLARMLGKTGRLEEAEVLYRRALAIDEKTWSAPSRTWRPTWRTWRRPPERRSSGRGRAALPPRWRSTSDGSGRTIPSWRTDLQQPGGLLRHPGMNPRGRGRFIASAGDRRAEPRPGPSRRRGRTREPGVGAPRRRSPD